MSLPTFHAAAIGFCDEVLSAMRDRIAEIRNAGWNRADCTVDLNGLEAEQKHREENLERVTRQKSETNWGEVRNHLGELKSQIALI